MLYSLNYSTQCRKSRPIESNSSLENNFIMTFLCGLYISVQTFSYSMLPATITKARTKRRQSNNMIGETF